MKLILGYPFKRRQNNVTNAQRNIYIDRLKKGTT